MQQKETMLCVKKSLKMKKSLKINLKDILNSNFLFVYFICEC